MTSSSDFSDTKAIYDLTHRQVVDTAAGRLMREYLWAPFGGTWAS